MYIIVYLIVTFFFCRPVLWMVKVFFYQKKCNNQINYDIHTELLCLKKCLKNTFLNTNVVKISASNSYYAIIRNCYRTSYLLLPNYKWIMNVIKPNFWTHRTVCSFVWNFELISPPTRCGRVWLIITKWFLIWSSTQRKWNAQV